MGVRSPTFEPWPGLFSAKSLNLLVITYDIGIQSSLLADEFTMVNSAIHNNTVTMNLLEQIALLWNMNTNLKIKREDGV